jgi:hypothetical protein
MMLAMKERRIPAERAPKVRRHATGAPPVSGGLLANRPAPRTHGFTASYCAILRGPIFGVALEHFLTPHAQLSELSHQNKWGQEPAPSFAVVTQWGRGGGGGTPFEKWRRC